MMFRAKKKTDTKYHNEKTYRLGREFDSRKEGDRYVYLKAMESEGKIRNVECQVSYTLIPKQTEMVEVKLKTKTKMVERMVEHPAKYIADFVYEKRTDSGWETVVEDVKGSEFMVTEKAKLQKKLMYYVHRIKVRYVFNPTEEI